MGQFKSLQINPSTLSVQAPGVLKTLLLLSPGALFAPGDGKYKQPLGIRCRNDLKGQTPKVGANLPSPAQGATGPLPNTWMVVCSFSSSSSSETRAEA